MLGRSRVYPFCRAEEITAKRNRDGTYSVTMKTIVHYEGEPEPVIATVEMARANVSIEALVGSDDKQTLYTITIPNDEEPSELPQYQTTVEDWKMLGFRESDAKKLSEEAEE